MPADPLAHPEDPSSRVEALFAAYLAGRERDTGLDFDAFCEDHRAEAEDLRRFHDDWQRGQAAIGAAREHRAMGGPFAARLEELYGGRASMDVSLDPGPERAAPAATEVLVRRLAEHASGVPRYVLEGEVARGGMGAILKVW